MSVAAQLVDPVIEVANRVILESVDLARRERLQPRSEMAPFTLLDERIRIAFIYGVGKEQWHGIADVLHFGNGSLAGPLVENTDLLPSLCEALAHGLKLHRVEVFGRIPERVGDVREWQ
ncbi:hypothetical protein [Paraburkholderia sp. BR10923]|uniref:hypothetical protein n=1 Tax=Paraburkholderia sp. BR10923 TaxID=3236992 RepID=UPI0034CDC158